MSEIELLRQFMGKIDCPPGSAHTDHEENVRKFTRIAQIYRSANIGRGKWGGVTLSSVGESFGLSKEEIRAIRQSMPEKNISPTSDDMIQSLAA